MYVFVGNSENFSFLAFCFRLMFPPLSLDILKTFCTVSDDSLLVATVLYLSVHNSGYFELNHGEVGNMISIFYVQATRLVW